MVGAMNGIFNNRKVDYYKLLSVGRLPLPSLPFWEAPPPATIFTHGR
jgi:hypothetical protein